jgi:hypothetical protein
MRRLSYFLIFFSFIILLISLIGFFSSDQILQSETFFASVNVTDRIGFDVNSSALIFGNVIRGGSSTRHINLRNGYEYPVVAIVRAEGEIEELLHFDKGILVGEGETKRVGFSVIPSSDEDGLYVGNVTIELLRG